MFFLWAQFQTTQTALSESTELFRLEYPLESDLSLRDHRMLLEHTSTNAIAVHTVCPN